MRFDLKPISDTMATIRDAVSLLPNVLRTLDGIHDGVREMGDEVHRMRLGVDEMAVEVKAMKTGVEPLDAQLEKVAANIDNLEPRLEDLSLALHPMRRATGKLGRRRVRTAEGAVIELDESGIGELSEGQTEPGENVSHADGSPDS
ncbi:MAG: hypothetical protein M3383_07465 [Actinomycetota bacterium]|nr:hypothetical protein [Actinomycetota bacterium]